MSPFVITRSDHSELVLPSRVPHLQLYQAACLLDCADSEVHSYCRQECVLEAIIREPKQ